MRRRNPKKIRHCCLHNLIGFSFDILLYWLHPYSWNSITSATSRFCCIKNIFGLISIWRKFPFYLSSRFYFFVFLPIYFHICVIIGIFNSIIYSIWMFRLYMWKYTSVIFNFIIELRIKRMEVWLEDRFCMLRFWWERKYGWYNV